MNKTESVIKANQGVEFYETHGHKLKTFTPAELMSMYPCTDQRFGVPDSTCGICPGCIARKAVAEKFLDFKFRIVPSNVDIKRIQKSYLDWAKRMGWDASKLDWNNVLNHAHCELSEAWEQLRQGHAPDEIYYDTDGKIQGFPIEMADVILIILGAFARKGLDIESAINIKHAWNIQRETKKPNV